MNRYRSLLVHLSLKDEDASLIRYASKIAAMAGSSAIHFLHSSTPPDIPDSIRQKYPWLNEPMLDASTRRMSELIEANLETSDDVAISTEVVEKPTLLEILRQSQEKDSDMILIGHDDEQPDLAVKLVRKSTCSVFLLPADHKATFEHILVPVDLSSYSADALDVALAFAQASNLDQITAMYSFELPTGYHKTMIPKEQFEANLHQHYENELNQFLTTQDLRGIKPNNMIVCAPKINQAVNTAINRSEADLLVVGSRGRNAMASILLGSNAESILKDSRIPVVMVKRKGTGQSFLKALLSNNT